MRKSQQHIFVRKQKLIVWLVAVAGITALLSCEDIMNVSFSGDSTQILVVEGGITTDTTWHRVKLSYTGDYFDKKEKVAVTGAEVSISDGTQTISLRELVNGEYYTDINVYGEVGKTYTLHVKLLDGREYSASDYLRGCGTIDSISQSVNYNTWSGYGYDVLFYGREKEPAGDYYMYLLYLNGKLYSDTITEVGFVSDEFINGKYISEFQVYRIREADLLIRPAKVTLEMISISKAYYDFLTALMIETVWRGTPWDGPPANIPGNISNGGKGFFRASAVTRKSNIFFPLHRYN